MEKYNDIPAMLVTVGNGFSFDGSGCYTITEEQKIVLENYNIPFTILDN